MAKIHYFRDEQVKGSGRLAAMATMYHAGTWATPRTFSEKWLTFICFNSIHYLLSLTLSLGTYSLLLGAVFQLPNLRVTCSSAELFVVGSEHDLSIVFAELQKSYYCLSLEWSIAQSSVNFLSVSDGMFTAF